MGSRRPRAPYHLLDPLFQGDDKRVGLSFPRFFVIPTKVGI
ncbi:MAG: hypothetical protein SFT68_05970 [Rickettsiaceae bacterium]|nr:hypothetical protein [Rickettsiaceae bacterium]